MERRTLPRQSLTAKTSYGTVCVKKIERPDGGCCMPEYESVREICSRTGEGFGKVYETVRREIGERES